MKYLIVDDLPMNQFSLRRWLLDSEAADAEFSSPVERCDAMGFEEALALGPRWREYDRAIVDAFDIRGDERRAEDAAKHGVPGNLHDRFRGRDVVLEAKKHHPGISVIVTSTYAASTPYLARQFAGAGADYLFRRDQIFDQELFVAAVRAPERYRSARQRSRREDRNLNQVAALLAAASEPERNAVLGRPQQPGAKPARRKVDSIVRSVIDAFSLPPQGGSRRPYMPRIRPLLREYFGQHLPNDDRPLGHRDRE
ncbi:hypothetical protein [Streptomyces sp. NPDC003401]